MMTLCTKDREKWFTEEAKERITKAYNAAFGCRIVNLDITGFDRSILASGYPMDTNIYKDSQMVNIVNPEMNIKDILANAEIVEVTDKEIKIKHGNPEVITTRSRRTLAKLAACDIGSGHDAYLKGITIQFNLDYPVWLSPQIQRYSHIFYVSSTSAMQRLTDLTDISKYVDPTIADTPEVKAMQERINIYKEFVRQLKNKEIDSEHGRIVEWNYGYGDICYGIVDISEESIDPFETSHKLFTKDTFYHYMIALCPQGLMKTVEITTNALQLKNVINQRLYHKMPEWRYMCEVFKNLPIWRDLGVEFLLNKLCVIEKKEPILPVDGTK